MNKLKTDKNQIQLIILWICIFMLVTSVIELNINAATGWAAALLLHYQLTEKS
jgi:hypothetical protein